MQMRASTFGRKKLVNSFRGKKRGGEWYRYHHLKQSFTSCKCHVSFMFVTVFILRLQSLLTYKESLFGTTL